METANGQGNLIRVLAGGLLCLYVLFGWFVGSNIHGGLDPAGTPVGYDFSDFYEAGRFAVQGEPEKAYDDESMFAAERAAFPGALARLPWNYPPSFQLLMIPLASLPYFEALALWSALMLAAYAAAMRLLFGPPFIWLALVFPGVALNLLMGQNGLLTTALIGGGTMLLSRRPFIAGLLLGAMSYKPHLAILIPVALICGREWKALAGAITAGAGLASISAAALGTGPWLAFIHKMQMPAGLLVSGAADWAVRPSVMVMAQSLGMPIGIASAAQWLAAAAAAICVGWAWRNTADGKQRAAVLALGTLLATPYLRTYDLALLAVPVAALIPPDAMRLRPAAFAAAAACLILPAYLVFAKPTLQIAPIVVAVAALFVAKRGTKLTCSTSNY